MSQRRTLILVAAIAIGALASFLVWNYVNGVQDEAFNNAEQVPVYLVRAPIARGSSGLQAQPSIVKENIPRKFKPSNAITSIEDISGKVAVSDLVPNQVVVSDMFVDASDPAARATFAERLTKLGKGADGETEDQVAISITVDQVHGVAGLIQPGDYVNIMMAPRGGTTEEGAGSTTGSPTPLGARYLYQKAIVLAVGQNAVPQAGAASAAAPPAEGEAAAPENNAGLITLMVPARAAQYIASIEPSLIYLTLVARDYQPEAQTPLDPNEPLPAEDPSQLTPYGVDGPDAAG